MTYLGTFLQLFFSSGYSEIIQFNIFPVDSIVCKMVAKALDITGGTQL